MKVQVLSPVPNAHNLSELFGRFFNLNNIYVGDFMFKVKNDFKGANIPQTIRFTEEIFEELNEIASENEVSFNLLVLQCCKYAIENSEYKKEQS